MADLARALNTPVPATQPAQTTFDPPSQRDRTAEVNDAKKIAKNERDRLRRKKKRAAEAKAREAAAKPKKKKRRSAKVARARVAAQNAAPKKRGRGRPPGAKNKPKVGLAVALVPAPGVLPRAVPIKTDVFGALNVAMNAIYALPVPQRVDVLTMLNRLFG